MENGKILGPWKIFGPSLQNFLVLGKVGLEKFSDVTKDKKFVTVSNLDKFF
jgi:hypothetical protein